MPIPVIVWGGLAVAGIWGVGYASSEANKALRYAAIGGGLYVSYRALKASGMVK